jgi:hypothetical protein
MTTQYDRAAEDVGNIVTLEHVNTLIPDQSQAHLFYVTGMGFTRDPYIDFGMRNMWINLGRQQFHLPIGAPQVLRGRTGIVVPSLTALEERLNNVAPLLEGTAISWVQTERDGHKGLRVTTPWGNVLDVSEANDATPMRLGMPYVEFDVPPDTADGIARFYQQAIGAPAHLRRDDEGVVAIVTAGIEQTIRYRETDTELPAYDGHHIAIYVADFSAPHAWLNERGLVAEESNRMQYRFNMLVDPETGKELFEVEHEVRSLSHPMYGRALVNRNPQQTPRTYARGCDAFQG